MHLRVYVALKGALLIQVYSVSNQAMVQEVVIRLLIQWHIHKLKVIHVVRYLEEVILQIKHCARLRQVILVSVIQRRLKGRGRPLHRGVTGTPAMANCTTTQIPPPQHPVPPPDPVSVYLHRNVHKSMETNQTLQAVSVVLKDVLLLIRIATNLQVLVELYRIVTKKMVLQPTRRPVSVDQINVLLLIRIVINL